MYIDVVPNRKSPPAVLLRESYRKGGKVRKRTLANLSKLPPKAIEGLRVLLGGGVAVEDLEKAFEVTSNPPYGHVLAALGTARSSPSARAKARTQRTPDGLPVHGFQTLMQELATVAKSHIQPRNPSIPSFHKITGVTPLHQKVFSLLGLRY